MDKKKELKKNINKQNCKKNGVNGKSTKLTNKEKAAYDDMRQIEWNPVDPYND